MKGVAEIAERVRARSFDLSAFMKELKQKMTLAYFTDGVVLGSQEFVDRFFERRRGDFGKRRKDGGRRMKGADWGGLRVLRALKDDVINGQ